MNHGTDISPYRRPCSASALLPMPELLRPHEDPELQRHVEPRQSRLRIPFHARDVVDRVLRLGDDAHDLDDPHITRVFRLQSTSGDESAVMDRENHRPEQRRMLLIERAVDDVRS